MSSPKGPLIWLDLEMTGLEPDRDTIMEIGTVVTDSELNLLAEGPVLAIHLSDPVLAEMDAWCTEHHGKSGLTQRCRESQVSMAEAEQKTLDFLKSFCQSGASPLCGNSISQDRRFLCKYMPALNSFFHYRNVDVSSIKELVNRWYPPSMHAPPKKKAHYVLDDIRESIDELKFYKKTVFLPPQ